jgi:zinc D-Ala-D-Ala dipeptidase
MRVSLGASAFVLLAVTGALAGARPRDFVDAATVVPGLVLDMRYPTANNFVGRPIAGYRAAKCLLTKRAANALKDVQEELAPRGLGLKVYDCYRPQRAVDDFVAWGHDLSDQKMKAEFYPHVDKRRLFHNGYIASRSGHSRGSTVDLTIVPLDATAQPARAVPLASCEGPWEARAPDTSLDMGTSFDCFSVRSHSAYDGLEEKQRANRRILKSVMHAHGFIGLRSEWWHYTLADEPYPHTYFDFPVE